MIQESSSLNTSNVICPTVNQNFTNKKHPESLKWIIINGGLFLVFVYDLSCKCPGHMTVLHYVEVILMTIFGANLLHHCISLLFCPDVIEITARQRSLLGLSSCDVDSSFNGLNKSLGDSSDEHISNDSDNLSISLSPARSWRSRGSTSPPSPLARSKLLYSTRTVLDDSISFSQCAAEKIIADQPSLTEYLKQYGERKRVQQTLDTTDPGTWGISSAPQYQLACTETDRSARDDSSPQGSPQVWWRLHLDPQRLTQFNLNLRLWISKTILERLVREIELIDETLAKHGLTDVRIGQVNIERLRQMSACSVASSLPTLLSFLDPFPDQCYVVQRIRELSQGGCLSNYRWNRGGLEWEESKPTDAELVISLFATYLDGQLPGTCGARPFSVRHLSAEPAHPPRPPALAIHRLTRLPPHYVLVMGDETLEVARGRNNLLHTMLLFIAAVARPAASGSSPTAPPVLHRVHLGPAGLNMLWIIGL